MNKFKSTTHAIAIAILAATVAAAKWVHAHPSETQAVAGIIANYGTYSVSGLGAALIGAFYFPSKK